MPDPARLAIEHALTLAERQVAALRLALGIEDDRFVPLAEAAPRLRIELRAAQKRALQHGEKVNGRWGFRESYIRRYEGDRIS